MKLPTLYSRTQTGAIQTWTIEVLDECYRTHYGQLGGAIQTTEWTECIVTNEGRANERPPHDQADFEAQSAWQKKVDTGYHQDINNVDTQFYVEPMLAKKWVDRKDKVKFPVYCQRKSDGARAIINRSGAFSRNGKPWVTIPHILKELEVVFKEFPNLNLDGELYNHDFKDDFNKIMSLIKKQKPTKQDLDESEKYVQFHCYDICDASSIFSERSIKIKEIVEKYNLKYVIPVATYVAKNNTELDSYYEQFLEEGWEGQMVRLNTPYEFKRSANLLKRKEFQDEEFEILDVLEGVGNSSGMAAKLCHLTKEGEPFESNIKGPREYKAEMLKNKKNYIGKLATVVYFNKTPGKLIPRFGYTHSVRDYE